MAGLLTMQNFLQELVEMIKEEGAEVPGEMYWDPVDCEMKKAGCPKQVGCRAGALI